MAQSASEKIGTAIELTLEQLGYELVDAQVVKENQQMIVRLFIDFVTTKEECIGLEDCEKVSRAVGDILDTLYDMKYFLEVSSPGLERVLKKERDFLRFIGREISIKLFDKIENQKSFIGILSGYEAGVVTLEWEGKTLQIEQTRIAKANLVYHF